MVLPVTSWGDNPSLPLSAADTYIPDQLIADPKTLQTRNAIITGGVKLQRGTVMGMTNTTGLAGSAVAGSGNTGNGVISAISFGQDAMPGIYRVDFTAATTFTVVNPDGAALVPAGVNRWGPSASNWEIGFTFTAGGVAMVAGDAIAIVSEPTAVAIWRQSKAGSNDGSEVPRGILVDYSDSTLGNVTGGIYTRGDFNGNALIYDSSFTLAQVSNLLMQNATMEIRVPVSAIDPS